MKLIASKQTWRSDLTEVNIADRSTKLPETYREPPKLGVDFEDNQANYNQILDDYNLEPVKPVASKSGMRTDQVDLSMRTNEKLLSRLKQPPQVDDLCRAPRTTAEGEQYNSNYNTNDLCNAISTQPNFEYGRTKLDTNSRIKLRQELLRGLGQPFDG